MNLLEQGVFEIVRGLGIGAAVGAAGHGCPDCACQCPTCSCAFTCPACPTVHCGPHYSYGWIVLPLCVAAGFAFAQLPGAWRLGRSASTPSDRAGAASSARAAIRAPEDAAQGLDLQREAQEQLRQAGAVCACYTPDGDSYEEDLGAGRDAAEWCFLPGGAQGGAPPAGAGGAGARLYRFRAIPLAAELGQARDRAAQRAGAAAPGLPLAPNTVGRAGAPPAGVGMPGVAPAAAGAAAVAGGAAAAGAPGALAPVPAGAGVGGGLGALAAVLGPAGGAVAPGAGPGGALVGAAPAAPLAPVAPVAGALVAGLAPGPVAPPAPPPAGGGAFMVSDLRVHPIVVDTMARRHRPFAEALPMLTETLTNEGGVEEHLRICTALENAVCFDQLNVTEMASFELLGRSLQIIEEKYRERTAGAADPVRMDQHLYLGTELVRGNCSVCPALQAWVSQELAQEHAILKERRKAREERAAAQTATKAKAKRDLFPLPPLTLRCGAGGPGPGRSRVVGRRRQRSSKTTDWANSCIDSLNSAYGFAKSEQPSSAGNAGQRAALAHIESQFLQLGGPPADSPGGAGALAELCAAGGPYHAEPSSTRPCAKGNVSLPDGAGKPVPLLDLLAEGDRKWLGSSCGDLLRPESEALSLVAEGMCVSGGDIDNCFYRIGLPSELREYFPLPDIAAGYLGLSTCEGRAVSPRDSLAPVLTVLPMGWSWAMHLVQIVLVNSLVVSGFPQPQMILDGGPGKELKDEESCVVAGYVDNFFVFSRSASRAQAGRDAIAKRLTTLGLLVHEMSDASKDAEFLGVELVG
ncbi:unnamed protein product, partial [Prorocentrum cordatum]